MFGSNLVIVPSLSLVRICLWSESGFRSGFVLGPSLSFVRIDPSSEIVAGPNLVLCPNLSLIRNCVRLESGFRSGFFFGLNLSLVQFCLWSKLFCDVFIWFLFRICIWCQFVLVRIWFSFRIVLWSESGCQSEFFFGSFLMFGPSLSLVRVCLWTEFVFGPSLSLDRVCLWSEFVSGSEAKLALESVLLLVQIWFSLWICVWSESGFRSRFVVGPNLSLVRICRCSKFGFRSGFVFVPTLVFGPNLSLVSNQKMRCNLFFGPKPVFRSILVFATKLYLLGIWFSMRICHPSESVFRSKSGFMSKSVFGPQLILVRNCLWSEFVFGSELCSVRLWFSVRIFPRSVFVSGSILLLVRTWLWSLSGFRSGFFFGPNLSLVQFCLWSKLLCDVYLVFGPNLSLVPKQNLRWNLFCC